MKKQTIVSLIVFLVIIATCVMYFGNFFGRKPFRNLDNDKILSFTVSAFPPGKTVEINEADECMKLADVLKKVVIYQEDSSGRDSCGQLGKFKLSMKDGSMLEVGAYNPFIFINGACYRTKYEPCEELNVLGNKLINGN